MRTALLLTAALALTACKTTEPPAPAPQPAPEPVRQAPSAYTILGPDPAAGPVAPGDVRRVLLDVRGMTCPIKCVKAIKGQLLAVTGVEDVVIDYDRKTAMVRVAQGTNPRTVAAGVRPPYSAHVLQTLATAR